MTDTQDRYWEEAEARAGQERRKRLSAALAALNERLVRLEEEQDRLRREIAAVWEEVSVILRLLTFPEPYLDLTWKDNATTAKAAPGGGEPA